MADDSLEGLVKFIKETMPSPKDIKAMEINHQAKVVVFNWQSKGFVVTPLLVVSERKGINLFKTASSTLIQSALAGRKQIQQIAESAVESLRKAEDFIQVKDLESMHRALEGIRALLNRHIIRPASSQKK